MTSNRDTYGAVEALTVVVVVQGLHPLVAGFDGESAGEALGREQFVPVGFAVRVAFLQEERAVAEQLAAVGTLEALRMELLADGVQAVSLWNTFVEKIGVPSSGFVSNLP